MTDFLLKNIVSAENLVNFTATDTAIVKNGIIMSGTDSGTGDVHNITIVAPNDASFTASYTLIMPVNDGNVGQVLTTDGSGVLSWNDDAGGLFSEDSNGGGITDHNIYGGTGAGGSLASGAVENFLAGVNAGNALTTGDSNICIGNTALLVGTDAIQNVAIGVGSLSSAVSINGANTNSRNVAIGHDSLLNVNGSAFSEGGYNVAIGDSTGATATTANSCILIGASANVSGATVGNEIVIGYGATGKGANTVLIGNDDTTDVYIGQSSAGTSPPNLVLVGDDGGTDYTIKIRAPSSGSFTANSELVLPADVPVAGEVLKVTSIGSGVATLEWGIAGTAGETWFWHNFNWGLCSTNGNRIYMTSGTRDADTSWLTYTSSSTTGDYLRFPYSGLYLIQILFFHNEGVPAVSQQACALIADADVTTFNTIAPNLFDQMVVFAESYGDKVPYGCGVAAVTASNRNIVFTQNSVVSPVQSLRNIIRVSVITRNYS